jgi:hypothetical protein
MLKLLVELDVDPIDDEGRLYYIEEVQAALQGDNTLALAGVGTKVSGLHTACPACKQIVIKHGIESDGLNDAPAVDIVNRLNAHIKQLQGQLANAIGCPCCAARARAQNRFFDATP